MNDVVLVEVVIQEKENQKEDDGTLMFIASSLAKAEEYIQKSIKNKDFDYSWKYWFKVTNMPVDVDMYDSNDPDISRFDDFQKWFRLLYDSTGNPVAMIK